MTASYQLFDALPSHIEDALRASIQRFGVLVPITVDQHGDVLDGHHRKRIADTLRVPYDRLMRVCESDDERREIAHTLNADRRQLSGDELRAAVVHLAEWRDRQGVGLSNVQIAEALHVVEGTIRNELDRSTSQGYEVDRPERVRGKDGKDRPSRRPQIIARDDREQHRAQAALEVVPDVSAPRTLDVKRAERIARETVAEQRRAEPVEPVTVDDTGAVDIRHGDFREVLGDLTAVDAIITDPPYPGEFRPLFADLGELAARILAPDGVLAVMCGQYYLPDYITLLSEHLAYRWCGAYITQGPRTRVHAAKVGTGWKPILLFQRADADPAFILDDLFDSAGDDKRHHHWGQSESGMSVLVERLTRPGALVVDPFLGGGTTAVVCRDLGRRFVGCDVDAGHVATSRERVA